MKEKKILVNFEDFEDFDLDDLILSGLGDVVFNASRIFGSVSVEVKFPSGNIILDRPTEKPSALFNDRLRDILDSAKLISKQTNIEYDNITGSLLVLDGWSWNNIIFRAPIWMLDHKEIPIKDARMIKGLEWLKGTSLEIKSKQNMVLAGLEK